MCHVNHVTALLLELADYSLSQFNSFMTEDVIIQKPDNGLRHERVKSVPEEIACTSRLRQWGVPGETMQKAPVMETSAQKQPISKGITSTLYDPRKVDDRAINWEKIIY